MIGAYTPVCQEDEGWVGQYLDEVSRLGVAFAVHFDRCDDTLKKRMTSSWRCIGHTSQDDPDIEYRESCRDPLMKILRFADVTLAMLWDIDETWERQALVKLRDLDGYKGFDNAYVHWYNLWDTEGDTTTHPLSIRLDNPSNPYRLKIHRLDSEVDWVWRGGVVVDPYPKGREASTLHSFHSDLVCLHHGLKTRELREQHKARWDRVYGHHLGKNPYTYWDYLLDEVNHPPVLGRNLYE